MHASIWFMKFPVSFMISQLKNFNLTNELLEVGGVRLSVSLFCSLVFVYQEDDEASY
jgi:hypothetical protein